MSGHSGNLILEVRMSGERKDKSSGISEEAFVGAVFGQKKKKKSILKESPSHKQLAAQWMNYH